MSMCMPQESIAHLSISPHIFLSLLFLPRFSLFDCFRIFFKTFSIYILCLNFILPLFLVFQLGVIFSSLFCSLSLAFSFFLSSFLAKASSLFCHYSSFRLTLMRTMYGQDSLEYNCKESLEIPSITFSVPYFTVEIVIRLWNCNVPTFQKVHAYFSLK